MKAVLCKLVDRVAIEFAAARMPRDDGRNPHLEEADRLLESADFFSAPAPARVEFEGERSFRFDTPRPGPFPKNNVVWGRFYRCAGTWQEHPTVLLLHGWNDVINHFWRFPLLARKLNRAGINAATLVAPYHFRRRPAQLGAWGNFLCPDLLRTVEATGQAVAENRAFAGWLLGEGCPAVGLWGISMGGWLAGLSACQDSRFSCAVLTVPVARLDRLMEEASFCRGIRSALRGRRIGAAKLNLTQNQPALPRENVLLIEAEHDLFVPPETVEELWQSWGRPEIWRLPYGHIAIMAVPGLAERVTRWLTTRLREPAVK